MDTDKKDTMQYRALGSTDIQISAISFGAGPVPALMTNAHAQDQFATVRRALEAGINWFDTAATYGGGESERSLGAALRELGAVSDVHVATKVRLMPEHLDSMQHHVRTSVAESLQRLGLPRVTLLQLHNSITAQRGDEPTALTPQDVLAGRGVLEVFEELKREGLVRYFGLTAIGQPAALHEVIRSARFDTIQVPYNLFNPSAGQRVPQSFQEADYGDVIAECAGQRMGVLAIRVYAGGALAGNPPSEHTHKTKFFPLDLYRRDQERVARLKRVLADQMGPKEAAVRFVLSHPDVSSAIIGFGAPSHIDEALEYLAAGLLPPQSLETLRRMDYINH